MISFMKGVNIIIATDRLTSAIMFCMILKNIPYSSEIHTDSSLYKLINYSHMMSLTPSNNFFIAGCMLSWEILFTMSFASTAAAAAGQQTFVFMAPL